MSEQDQPSQPTPRMRWWQSPVTVPAVATALFLVGLVVVQTR